MSAAPHLLTQTCITLVREPLKWFTKLRSDRSVPLILLTKVAGLSLTKYDTILIGSIRVESNGSGVNILLYHIVGMTPLVQLIQDGGRGASLYICVYLCLCFLFHFYDLDGLAISFTILDHKILKTVLLSWRHSATAV